MIDKESLRTLGNNILRSVPEEIMLPCEGYRDKEIWALHVPQFSKYFLNLNREDGTLSPDGSCIGASVFEYCWITFYNRNGEPRNREVRPHTVIVDSDLYRKAPRGAPGRYRFTEMHECCHHIMVRAGFSTAEPVKYRYVGIPDSREEQEADWLAAYLLMPDSVLTAIMRERDWEPFISYEGFLPLQQQRMLQKMSRGLRVSATALNRRLEDAGWFEYRPVYEFFDPDRPNFDPLRRTARYDGTYDRRGT